MSKKILLCVSNTGGGHRSAASAVKHAIEELIEKNNLENENYEVIVNDVVENSSVLHRGFVALYNYLLRYHQNWMKYYFAIIEAAKPDNSSFGYFLAAPYLRKLLSGLKPTIIVSLHPMANHYLARAIKEMSADGNFERPHLILVVLDPNSQLWTGWACKSADMIITPNVLATERLIALGISRENLRTIGMPIEPAFLKPAINSRSVFLKALGLSPDLVTICMSAGWAGGGNFLKIYRALKNLSNPERFQFIFVCGNNQDLYNQIERLSLQMPFQTKVVQELASLSDTMSACDLLVTKAGGLTTYEAVARRLPMAIDMLTPPMPQEAGTADLLFEMKLARAITEPGDVISMISTCHHIEKRDEQALPSKYNLNRTDAVYEIAEIILSNCLP